MKTSTTFTVACCLLHTYVYHSLNTIPYYRRKRKRNGNI